MWPTVASGAACLPLGYPPYAGATAQARKRGVQMFDLGPCYSSWINSSIPQLLKDEDIGLNLS